MARQNINIGASANDGTGDTLRQAGIKLNETLVEVYKKLGGDSDQLTHNLAFDSNYIVFGGNNDTVFRPSNPNADITIRLPDSDGTLITAEGAADLVNKTLTNATLNSPDIIGLVGDSSSNPILGFTARNNAVNYIGLRNAETGVAPTMYADGEDSNISIRILPKAAGSLLMGKVGFNSITHTTQDSLPTSTSLIFMDGSNLNVVLGDGEVVGEYKLIVNTNASLCRVTPKNSATGPLDILPGDAYSLVWNGANWYIVSEPLTGGGD